MKILVIEDDKKVAQAVKKGLESDRYAKGGRSSFQEKEDRPLLHFGFDIAKESCFVIK